MSEAIQTDDSIERALQAMAEGFSFSNRSPILHSPAEVGLAYENITFPSLDGIPLEGWFIPAPGSDRIVILNHPRWFSRSGLPSHLEPWKSLGAAFGNDFEVNFVPDFKILHDAGYNVLAYDLRNFGHSGAANGGVSSSGNFECRDVVGSLNYVRGRSDLREMSVGLFSRCLGCNATLVAMARYPDAFENVRCLVGCQPLSPRYLLEKVMTSRGIPAERVDDLDELMRLKTSFTIDDLSPAPAAKSVRIPTFLYQVRDDAMTTPKDVQTIYDNMPIEAKKLFWIEGSTRRWDGYTYFQKDPSLMLDWFATYLT
ncbi:hypothetical protein ABTY63_28480 [Streptomyces solisilvae]|uniref:alpha/beta hydrolase family protein n=1 Tax=Streptomyces malaysiensis TaxID=92644 RepID=UPI003331C99C